MHKQVCSTPVISRSGLDFEGVGICITRSVSFMYIYPSTCLRKGFFFFWQTCNSLSKAAVLYSLRSLTQYSIVTPLPVSSYPIDNPLLQYCFCTNPAQPILCGEQWFWVNVASWVHHNHQAPRKSIAYKVGTFCPYKTTLMQLGL